MAPDKPSFQGSRTRCLLPSPWQPSREKCDAVLAVAADIRSNAPPTEWLALCVMPLLPHICLLCDQVCAEAAAADLCTHCRASLPWNQRCCIRCAVPLDDTQADDICGECRTAAPPYLRCVAPLRYESHPRIWIQRLKFHHGLVEARLLGTLLAESVGFAYRQDQLPDVIVPVPLSMRRLARRGHNQALGLASVVGRHLHLPVNRTRVTRTRHGPTQRTLTRDVRQANLEDAFGSRPWRGERIAVIDDVMTTGATVKAVADTLLNAGASEVHAWCATRTPAGRFDVPP
jgi:ComF family protein